MFLLQILEQAGALAFEQILVVDRLVEVIADLLERGVKDGEILGPIAGRSDADGDVAADIADGERQHARIERVGRRLDVSAFKREREAGGGDDCRKDGDDATIGWHGGQKVLSNGVLRDTPAVQW